MDAPELVDEHSDELFTEAGALLGDRFAEARFDPDRGLRVTVIEPTDQDIAAIAAVAERLGIAAWVRIERAEPAALEAWERLRHDLRRLQALRPRVLTEWPTPDPGYRRPPVEIHLVADAVAAAADLHATYGAFVSLTVGALPYPATAHSPRGARTPRPSHQHDVIDPSDLRVALDGHLSIQSGQTVTHGLLLINRTDNDIVVHTNGHLTADIVDDTGAVVGGYSGAQHQPLVTFTAGPAQTVRLPLLVGTASFVPDLGYAVPAGTWHLTAQMQLSDGRQLTTPNLKLTITG